MMLCALVLPISGSRAAGPESPPTEQKARVDRMMREVTGLVPKWIEAGGDRSRVAPLGQKVDEYLRAGDLANAEATLDRILRIVRGQAGPPKAPGAGGAREQAERAPAANRRLACRRR